MITLHKHEISANIDNKYATINYCFDFENTRNDTNELMFELTIHPNAFISHFEANIDGQIFIGQTKPKETAAEEYKVAKQNKENAILISQPYKDIPNVFKIQTNIDAKSKISLTITIEQYLQKKFEFNELDIQLLQNFSKYNITKKFQFITFQSNIYDESGIYDIHLPSIFIDENIMNKQHTEYKIKGKMNILSTNELQIKYKIKGEANPSRILFDKQTNTFCHIISDILTDAILSQEINTEGQNNNDIQNNVLIPRRVVFCIDRSGSMQGSKWNKTISSTIYALKQMRKEHDRFCIILFDDKIETLPQKNMKKCIFTGDKSVCDCIKAFENSNTGGSTNINDSLLHAIDLIKTDIISLNNESSVEYNFFMNQIIFITDGKPNAGIRNTNEIVSNIKAVNDLQQIDKYNTKISIYTFGVGNDGNDSGWVNDLNHSFLKILAVNNNGFYQRIKQSTADVVLSEYFSVLSKPVLLNINVEYKNKNINQLTKTKFNTLYFGNDIIVCGKIENMNVKKYVNYNLSLVVTAVSGTQGIVTKPIHISKKITVSIDENNVLNGNNTERVWAYMKLQEYAKQKLIYNDMIEMDDDEKEESDALPLSLALRYKFVTPWTSMIVVKKKDKSDVVRKTKMKILENKSTDKTTALLYDHRNKISQINAEIDSVKGTVVQSIDKVLERGEKIELLVCKSDYLSDNAVMFNRHSKRLKRGMLWKNIKITLVLVLICLVIVYLVTSAACGFDFHKC